MPAADLSHWISWFLAHGAGVSLLVLACAAAIEYLFPPFPGDTITLAGAVLATRGGWNMGAVLLAVTAGSVAGAWLDFRFGRVALRVNDATHPGLQQILAGYRRWGAPFLALNRFFPGIRALFFVAAGMAEMKTLPVLIWAAVSALAWNLLILALGTALGNNLERLQALLREWSLGVALLLLAVGLAVGLLLLVRRGRRAR